MGRVSSGFLPAPSPEPRRALLDPYAAGRPDVRLGGHKSCKAESALPNNPRSSMPASPRSSNQLEQIKAPCDRPGSQLKDHWFLREVIGHFSPEDFLSCYRPL
jgi:hypothetical protein